MKKTGFTLAELLVALLIIAILSALIAPTISNLIPDKNKTKVIKYNTIITDAIDDILGNENLYAPYVVYDKTNTTDSEPTILKKDLSIVGGEGFKKEFVDRIGIDASNKLSDGSEWTIADDGNGGYTVSINVNTDSSNACSYTTSDCDIKKAGIFIFNIDDCGNVTSGDFLTQAYLRNPLNMKDRKKDFDLATELLKKATKE